MLDCERSRVGTVSSTVRSMGTQGATLRGEGFITVTGLRFVPGATGAATLGRDVSRDIPGVLFTTNLGFTMGTNIGFPKSRGGKGEKGEGESREGEAGGSKGGSKGS